MGFVWQLCCVFFFVVVVADKQEGKVPRDGKLFYFLETLKRRRRTSSLEIHAFLRLPGHVWSDTTHVAPVINNGSIDQTLLMDHMFQEDDYKSPPPADD